MKNKGKYILILILVGIFIAFMYFINHEEQEEIDTQYSESEVIKTDILNTLSSSSYVETGLEEKKELHATYYFSEIYFETNKQISAGENILKYTNGTYMVAPYDCIITEISVPNAGEVCTSKHYITIQSTNTLEITMAVEEDELSNVYEGQEAKIQIESLDNKLVTGYVTNIGNTGTYSSSGSKFDIVVGFENDGEILLGMSAKCEVVLEKAESAIAVPKEAVTEENNQKYVNIKNNNGQSQKIQIETGIENDAYIEVKSGLSEGNVVLIEQMTSSNSNSQRGMMNSGAEMPQRNKEQDQSQGERQNNGERPQ